MTSKPEGTITVTKSTWVDVDSGSAMSIITGVNGAISGKVPGDARLVEVDYGDQVLTSRMSGKDNYLRINCRLRFEWDVEE